MTELCKAHHSYEAQREDELSFGEGEVVRITNNADPEWWEVEKVEGGEKGWVPSNFFDKVQSAPNTEGGKTQPVLATVLEDYESTNHEELSLWKGGIVTVDDQSDSDWWHGDLNGKTGIFPKRNVQVIESKEGEDTAETPPGQASQSKPKNAFKLAAYGVKEGGIGSLMASGFPMLKKAGKRADSVHEHSASLARAPSVSRPMSSGKPETALPPPPAAEKPVSPVRIPSTPNVASSVPHEPTHPVDGKHKAIVINNYTAAGDDEIDLIAGEYVQVVDKNADEGWWKGTNESGRTGVFPANFVREVDDEPPLRPRRSRPPTVKTGSSPTGEPLASPSLAKPPPVPAGSRPTSLISNRRSMGHDTLMSPGSPQSAVKPALPSVPPPRRTASIPDEVRVPPKSRPISVSMRSPDLPPLSPQQDRPSFMHPSRPSRPVPTPHNELGEEEATSGKPVPQKHTSKIEPHSTSTESETPPTPPARTGRGALPHPPRPPVPAVPTEKDSPVKGLSIRLRPSSIAQEPEIPDVPPAKPRRPLSTAVEDGASESIHKLIEEAVTNVRNEFMEVLDEQSNEISRLRAELEDLRQRLDV
ncbi:hypothetical protein Unana1_05519 [Umbelopsis nana]